MNTSRSTPSITPEHVGSDWFDWRWQLRHALRSAAELDTILDLTAGERRALRHPAGLPFRLTPYYFGLINRDDPKDPLRRMVIPLPAEQEVLPGERQDPLGEEERTRVPGLVHRYPDRVLLLAAGECPVYCRYCTRGRIVGQRDAPRPNRRRWQDAVDYIADHTEVHDVLISGGDPLILGDAKLEWLVAALREIPHIDIIRIGSKVPFVLPMRITPDLCRRLQPCQPLYFSLHVNHPNEITAAACDACELLADHGFVLGSQTVLLQGINDDADTLRRLFRELLCIRVRPYYLLQCDPITGSGHFRVPVDRGLEIMRQLRGTISGYGIPQYILDIPGGAGKVPLSPDYIEGRTSKDLLLRDIHGNSGFSYPLR